MAKVCEGLWRSYIFSARHSFFYRKAALQTRRAVQAEGDRYRTCRLTLELGWPEADEQSSYVQMQEKKENSLQPHLLEGAVREPLAGLAGPTVPFSRSPRRTAAWMRGTFGMWPAVGSKKSPATRKPMVPSARNSKSHSPATRPVFGRGGFKGNQKKRKRRNPERWTVLCCLFCAHTNTHTRTTNKQTHLTKCHCISRAPDPCPVSPVVRCLWRRRPPAARGSAPRSGSPGRGWRNRFPLRCPPTPERPPSPQWQQGRC